MCLINVISINLSLEHPKRQVEAWANFLLSAENQYDVIAFQECLNTDGTNLASEIASLLSNSAATYVFVEQADAVENNDWHGDQVLLFEKSFFDNVVANPSKFIVFKSIHLPNGDYIPDLLKKDRIRNEHVYHVGERARSTELTNSLAEVDLFDNCIVMGDFNEPSHLDSEKKYYCSQKMLQLGFSDVMYVENTIIPTWPCDLYDEKPERIDFIYYKGSNLCLLSQQTISTGLSDHAAISATFKISI